MISVYADGSSGGRSNAPGGYGWVVLVEGLPRMAGYGSDVSTTNNRMEMMGLIVGLEAVKASDLMRLRLPIEVVSDSQYALGVASRRFAPSKNLDLVKRLQRLCAELCVTYRWVRGHVGDTYNERCDSLARLGKSEAKQQVEAGHAVQEG